MQKIFVLDKSKRPLMPCSAVRGSVLLLKRKAAVYKMYSFTLILKGREKGALQEIEVKIDPGSKTTGVALVGNFQKGTYFGRAGVRFSGNFCIDTSTGKVDGISHRY